MQTLEQRGYQIERLTHLRANKAIFPADSRNDGPLVEGCISGAKKYFHINATGDAEPCVFPRFATHNIRTSSLEEAINSPLFESIRCRLPVHENLLRPCCLIDRPEVSRAGILYDYLNEEIDQYAEEYGEVADFLWARYLSRDAKK